VKAWIETKGRGPVELETGQSGQFDLVIDGKLVYSRYAVGRFPSEADLEQLAGP
jgi:predicted Rdx family selenoprotein